jgi:pancreatic triacylglycerol lipase
MVDFLIQNGNSFSTMSIIGHSLGAHVSGIAGKSNSLGRLSKAHRFNSIFLFCFCIIGKIGTIIGLDPAGPLFSIDLPNERLASTDGDYVEVVHSDGDYSGIGRPIGQADFFPNGGMDQPGM